MTENRYTVKNPQRIKDDLELDSSPVGLIVKKEGNTQACTVKTIPPASQQGFSVSDKLLQEWLSDNDIETKEN